MRVNHEFIYARDQRLMCIFLINISIQILQHFFFDKRKYIEKQLWYI